SLAGTILDTGRSARIDDYSELPGTIAATMRAASMQSSVGVAIVVDGRVWGHLSVSAVDDRPLPGDVEPRLRDFTELVGTAISKAESLGELRRLAEEQAALVRLATLVAAGVPPQEIFSAVSEEVAQLFASSSAAVVRFEHGE